MSWVTDRLRGLGISGGGTVTIGQPGASATIRVGEPVYRWDVVILVAILVFAVARR
jgi:hypothetical protein